MKEKDIIKAIKSIDKDCTISTEINYEKFYQRVMGVIELADEITRPRGGGLTYG
jgi:hypothetical protein